MQNILIIEDNKLVRDVLAWRLGILLKDCTILTAADGREGIAILKKSPVDFILTDLFMPIVDGYGVVEYRNRNCPQLPVFVMTGMYSEEVRERLDSIGVKHCIEKPFDFDLVALKIAAALGHAGTSTAAPSFHARECTD